MLMNQYACLRDRSNSPLYLDTEPVCIDISTTLHQWKFYTCDEIIDIQ